MSKIRGKSSILISSYFKELEFGEAQIDTFNYFIKKELTKIIEENKEVEPTIIPHNVDEFKIRIDKIWVEKPEITEADGSKRDLYPTEARLRKLTYAAPCFIDVSAHINGIQRETFTTRIANIPIMLKSEHCHLYGLSRDELIEKGEDPSDLGGYFIVNGTEKVLINVEDLAPNRFLVERVKTGVSKYVGKIFSEKGSFKIPHTFERMKDGIFYLTFTRVKRIPAVVIMKALGLLKDEEIMKSVSKTESYDEILINLMEFSEIKTDEDALDYIAKKIGITQAKEIRVERTKEILDKYLLPHLGIEIEDRLSKAKNVAKLLKKFIRVSREELPIDDKDHYMNKRLKLAGDLLADLFRVNIKVLIGDLLYNFQRIVKRGKFPSIKVIIREKLLTQRIHSSMATGVWVGARKGISQRMDRLNYLATLSHLQGVTSPLSASQENFAARELHPTHYGRLCPVETPEGTKIGLRKNLAMLSSVSKDEDETELVKTIQAQLTSDEFDCEVYVNSKYLGNCENPKEFFQNFVENRREGTITQNANIYYDEDTNEIYIESLKGRVRRPLIVVKNKESLLSEKHLEQLEKGEVSWKDLVKQGIIEYLDVSEEENALVSFKDEEIEEETTHLEISPITMFGLTSSLVPFINYGPPARGSIGGKNQKQAIGFYASNFPIRMDMDINLLHTPQLPIVKTVNHDVLRYEDHPAGQNIVVAIMSYNGYNLEDAIIINKASIERGMGRSSYYRPSIATEIRYSGGLTDEICTPDKEVKGYKTEKDYRLLEADGIIYPEAHVKEGDVILGKTSPPRFLSSLDEYNLASNLRRESSVSIPHGEKGTVDFVVLTENEEGNKLVQVRMRDQRIPEIGDKFTSRYGQKGVIGMIVPQSSMPFSARGIVPDLMFSPHGIPSRMTVSHLLELLGGKVGSMSGRFIDGTSFEAESEEGLRKELLENGFREDGTETFYNGETGEKMTARIYVGNMYYLRLKHMVANKLHSRARGPVQLLTRQPTEGRAKEGGLRLGEMEKDTFVAHGASMLLKERFDSDKTIVPVCEKCGMVAIHSNMKNKTFCLACGDDTEISYIEMSYAFKLFLDELKSLMVYPKLNLKEKY